MIHPIKEQIVAVEEMLRDPKFDHVCFDISWDEVNKYAVSSEAAIERVADMLNRYPVPNCRSPASPSPGTM